jgi:condensin complex subunit 3
MAANSFGLFVQQLNAADDQLKLKVVQIIFDLLVVQDIPSLVSKTMPVGRPDKDSETTLIVWIRSTKSSN